MILSFSSKSIICLSPWSQMVMGIYLGTISILWAYSSDMNVVIGLWNAYEERTRDKEKGTFFGIQECTYFKCFRYFSLYANDLRAVLMIFITSKQTIMFQQCLSLSSHEWQHCSINLRHIFMFSGLVVFFSLKYFKKQWLS